LPPSPQQVSENAGEVSSDDVIPGIYPPILTIDYGALDVADLERGDGDDYMVSMKFQVEYVKDLDNFWDALTAIFTVAMTMAALEWIYRIFLFSKNRPMSHPDASFLGRVLVEAVGSGARWCFLLLFGMSGYWFLFFKRTTTVYQLLPTHEDRHAWRVMLFLGYLLKLVDIAHLMVKQCGVDIFFVDWEKSYGNLADDGHQDVPKAPEEGEEEVGQPQPIAQGPPVPVSCWRTLFITNEWAELQTMRQTSTVLTLFLTGFLLDGYHWDNLATSQPDMLDLRSVEEGGSTIDPMLHFFVSTLLIMLIWVVQWLFAKMFYQRFVSNPVENFLDLLMLVGSASIVFVVVRAAAQVQPPAQANHSGFILKDDGYTGWYLHGKAVVEHMDTDMRQLAANLKKEERQQTAPRGLGPNHAMGFEIYLHPKMRDLYKSQYELLKQGNQAPGAAEMALMGGKGGTREKVRAGEHAPTDPSIEVIPYRPRARSAPPPKRRQSRHFEQGLCYHVNIQVAKKHIIRPMLALHPAAK
jgi:meckelin